MNPSQKFLAKFGLKDPEPIIEQTVTGQPIDPAMPKDHKDRRNFLKKSFGGLAMGSFLFSNTGTFDFESQSVFSAFRPENHRHEIRGSPEWQWTLPDY